MSTITFSKVVSLGSGSENSTPPQPTPVADFANDAFIAHDTDLYAVNKTLAPIEEELNEKAHEAMYPTPPVHTPETFSPAPSVIIRQYRRARGLSILPERLAHLQLENSVDDTSSNHSAALSQDDDVITPSGSIPIGLGSPTVNPRLEEYLAHPPPRSAPIPLVGSGQVSHKNSKVSSGLQHTDNNLSQEGEQREGVREASTWSDVALSDLVEALERLEQVVSDLQEASGYPAADMYMKCLNECLKSSDRKYSAIATMEEKK